MDKVFPNKEEFINLMFHSLPKLDQIITHQLDLAQVYVKDDGSPVTDLDLAVSEQLELIAHNQQFHFYSEEKPGVWKFPMMMVDPVDGTKEFIAGRDEWVVSVALLQDQFLHGEGWIYNPLRKKIYQSASHLKFQEKKTYHGEASRTEWGKGYFQETFDCFTMSPMGSIAHKLGRLSNGEIDFVVSMHPKNLWDIAAGTLLCQQAGLKFYEAGVEVKEFKLKFNGPLIWCHEELYPKLSVHFY